MKEQPRAQEDREELLEPPSQIYSLQLWHCAAYYFCLGKKLLSQLFPIPANYAFWTQIRQLSSSALRVLLSTGSSSTHDTQPVPAVAFLSTAGENEHFYSAFEQHAAQQCPSASQPGLILRATEEQKKSLILHLSFYLFPPAKKKQSCLPSSLIIPSPHLIECSLPPESP